MKLISQIINELIDSEKSINGALLKTKVLASRIQNKELLKWINNELSGYDSYNELPNYRKNIQSFLKGSYTNGNIKYTNQPIPTIGLDLEFQRGLQFAFFQESITALEFLVLDNNGKTLGTPLKAEVVGMIGDNWQAMGNPYLQLMNVNKVISVNSIVEILSKVRNKLLDFMLKIDEEFGNITEISDLKEEKEKITSIMNTIINNTGDGNVVNTGDKAKISAKINISKGDKSQLEKKLLENGVSTSDTTELLEIIDTEEPNIEQEKFGVKVNGWTSKMLSKALDGSWNIAIGSAGGLLAELIKGYYGM